MKLKILITVFILFILQGCIKVQDTGDDDSQPKTQGVVFNPNGSVFGATKSGTSTDKNGRQALYTNKLVGGIDQDAVVYDSNNNLIGICLGRGDAVFDNKGYLVGECDLITECSSTGNCGISGECSTASDCTQSQN